jgi:hypothetical protein
MPDYIAKVVMERDGRIFWAIVYDRENSSAPLLHNPGVRYDPDYKNFTFWIKTDDSEKACKMARAMYLENNLKDFTEDTVITDLDLSLIPPETHNGHRKTP